MVLPVAGSVIASTQVEPISCTYRLTKALVSRPRRAHGLPVPQSQAETDAMHFNDELLNPGDITEFVRIGGEVIGLAEGRPKFGRYVVG